MNALDKLQEEFSALEFEDFGLLTPDPEIKDLGDFFEIGPEILGFDKYEYTMRLLNEIAKIIFGDDE